jgi:hypothetical protein
MNHQESQLSRAAAGGDPAAPEPIRHDGVVHAALNRRDKADQRSRAVARALD